MPKALKLFLILFLTILLGTLASATDVAYVIKNEAGFDSTLTSELSSLGFTYTTIYEDQVAQTDFSEYRFILVGDQRLDNPSNLPLEKHRSLVINSYNFYKTILDPQFGWSSARGAKTSPTTLTVRDSGSPIVAGLPLEFKAYSSNIPGINTYYLKGSKPQGADIVVSAGISTDTVIATVFPGDKYLNSKVAEAPAIFFGIPESEYWTPESRTLFSNSITWVLQGEDRDSDGFTSELDCDDTNPNVNPNGVEIAYDGIDQDCSGSDLNDLDNDGFIADIVGGEDCDDSNPLTNPLNPSVYFNCMNDAPLVNPISDKFAFESDILSIIVEASDPEGDSITYTVNDPRFSISDNVLSWDVSYDSEGKHNFTLTVSDGELGTDIPFNVTISGTNRVPIYRTIPTISWNEDEEHTIDLSDYFTDPDSDPLEFGVFNTSTNEDIFLEVSGSTFTFSASPNYAGEDWIEFFATDSLAITQSDRITLEVLGVNDAPLEISDLPESLTWEEDTLYLLDLSDYFEDIDSELSFTLNNNLNITPSLDSGVLTLTPDKNFAGSESIYLEISDSEFTLGPYNIDLIVLETEEPPEFSDLSCNLNIVEDTTYNCTLEATDFESDAFEFSILEETNASCEISESILYYTSEENFYGLASCLISVSDNDGSSELLLEFDISGVNDAPIFTSVNPTSNPKIPENYERDFFLEYMDPESDDVSVSWFLDGSLVSSSEEYTFKRLSGDYLLEVILNDSINSSSFIWDIFVGETSDFTCSELAGNVCSATQYCPADTLDSKDQVVCCAVSCKALPPEFSDADSCNVLSNELSIEFDDLDSKVEMGENLRVNLILDNNSSDSQDLDIDLYLYNLDEDEVVEGVSTTETVRAGFSRTLSLTLEVPEDIDFEDEYNLFVLAEDEICSEAFAEIDLERPEHSILFDSINLPSTVTCGDIVSGSVRLQNFGSNDEDISLTISNSELDLSESFDFEIEEAGESDKETRDFSFVVPTDINSGEQTITARARYNNRLETISEEVFVSCSEEVPEEREILTGEEGVIQLNPVSSEKIYLEKANVEDKSGFLTTLLLSTTFLISLTFILVVVLYIRRQD